MAKDEAKWAYWRKQIKDWQASGLSRNAYCKREGLKAMTIDYWRPLIVSAHAEGNAVKQAARKNDITLIPSQWWPETTPWAQANLDVNPTGLPPSPIP